MDVLFLRWEWGFLVHCNLWFISRTEPSPIDLHSVETSQFFLTFLEAGWVTYRKKLRVEELWRMKRWWRVWIKRLPNFQKNNALSSVTERLRGDWQWEGMRMSTERERSETRVSEWLLKGEYAWEWMECDLDVTSPPPAVHVVLNKPTHRLSYPPSSRQLELVIL